MMITRSQLWMLLFTLILGSEKILKLEAMKDDAEIDTNATLYQKFTDMNLFTTFILPNVIYFLQILLLCSNLYIILSENIAAFTQYEFAYWTGYASYIGGRVLYFWGYVILYAAIKKDNNTLNGLVGNIYKLSLIHRLRKLHIWRHLTLFQHYYIVGLLLNFFLALFMRLMRIPTSFITEEGLATWSVPGWLGYMTWCCLLYMGAIPVLFQMVIGAVSDAVYINLPLQIIAVIFLLYNLAFYRSSSQTPSTIQPGSDSSNNNNPSGNGNTNVSTIGSATTTGP